MNHLAPGAVAPSSLRNDIRLLGKTLGEVIKECDGKAVYEIIEKLRQAAVKFRREGDAASGKILERQIERLASHKANSVARAFSYFCNCPILPKTAIRTGAKDNTN